jgi:hypothetical protein
MLVDIVRGLDGHENFMPSEPLYDHSEEHQMLERLSGRLSEW